MTVAGRYARALSVVPASEALHEADLFCQQPAAQASLPENGGGRRAPGDHAASRLAAPASPGSAAPAARGSASASFASGPSLHQSLPGRPPVHPLLAQVALAGEDIATTISSWTSSTSSQVQHPVSVYFASVPLQPGKTVAPVALPTVSSGVGNGVTAMHLFAIATGNGTPTG